MLAGPCSLLELQALQKELEERNTQRDDLLYRLKVGHIGNKIDYLLSKINVSNTLEIKQNKYI